MDFKQTKVSDLRDELIQEYGYSQEQVDNIKGKSALVNEIIRNRTNNANLKDKVISPQGEINMEELSGLTEFFDSTEQEQDICQLMIETSGLNNNDIPEGYIPNDIDYTHPKWSDFVISHLEEDEKVDGYPTTNGLRRLTELLIGKIVDSTSNVVIAPSNINGKYACVSVKVTVETENGLISMDGCADANYENVERVYNRFLVANAQTRAEGRAFSRLLRLKTISAEEVVNEKFLEESDEKIGPHQINTINVLCKKLGIDVIKYLAKLGLQDIPLEKLNKNKATEICVLLNQYQGQGIESVPQDIKVETDDIKI